MKILVVQLLRLGDVIACSPVLQGLRKKYPQAQLDLLINGEFSFVQPLLPMNGKVINFPRKSLQRGLGEKDHSLFYSRDLLLRLTRQLSEEKYDLVINLTQNRLSGLVMGLIDSPQSLGMKIELDGKVNFGSIWFEKLNDLENQYQSHYTDVFINGAGVAPYVDGFGIQETQFGKNEVLENDLANKDTIVVQPLTSDEKKNWGLDNFSKMIRVLMDMHPLKSIVVLGAPNEEKTLRGWFDQQEFSEKRVQLFICSLEGAFSLLKRAKVLITGDTSIKHLGSAAKTPLVEISLGSSRIQSQGAYQDNACMIQSAEECAPCSHSQDCHRPRHFCSERVSADNVAWIVSHFMSQNIDSIKKIQNQNKRSFAVYLTEFSRDGFWRANSLSEQKTNNETSILQWKLESEFLEQQEKKQWIQKERVSY